MRRSKRGIALGAALCVLTLVVSVLLQKAGYLIYLNSDMASEFWPTGRRRRTALCRWTGCIRPRSTAFT